MPESKLINRSEYVAMLERHRVATDRIKVITGVRRCGKSTLLDLFKNKLRSEGIDKDQILTIDLEDYENMYLRDGVTLHKFVKNKASKDKLTYVFIDEVQFVPDYEDVILSLRKLNIDLYVTGSNNSLLKPSKKLVGRTQQIHMLPLSFKEFVNKYDMELEDVRPSYPLTHLSAVVMGDPETRREKQFQDYLTYGSFPGVFAYFSPALPQRTSKDDWNNGWNIKGAKEYLSDTYNDILVRDIMAQKGAKELPQLNRVINFLFSNIGKETSTNKMLEVINNEFKLNKDEKSVYAPILGKYLEALEESFLFYKAEVQRFGKNLIRPLAKYYAVDAVMRYNALGGTVAQDAGRILENVVYLELCRRGYKVEVGKVNGKELDFVAQSPDGQIEYYQVSQTVMDEDTLKRELAPFAEIKDNYPKFLLTRDLGRKDYTGIQQMNVLEWLLADK